MIVVTGMHRSGTSLIANVLLELGVDFGDPAGFYRADDWNERGYFEQREVVDLNARLVTGWRRADCSALERRLNQLVYLTLPSPPRIARRARRLRPELEALATRHRGRAAKDPRFCLTLDAWRGLAEVESVVVCLRHPAEVVDSLHRRQRIPRWYGYRFWDAHTERLLASLPGLPVLYLHYNALTSGGAAPELERAATFFALNRDADAAEAAFRRVFAGDLYHCRTDGGLLPRRTARLWDELLRRHAG